MHDQQLTLHEHIQELKRRLAWPVVAFLLGGGLGYALHKQLIQILRRPLHETLYYTSPAGGFNFVMKICMLVGLAFALPVLVYNAVEFVRPALGHKVKKRQAHTISAMSFVLAISGVLFAFYAVVPMSLKFFGGFGGNGIKSLLSASDYLEFVINHLLTFIIIFQLPLVILFIDRIKPLSPRTLLKYDKHVVVGAAALSVILPFTYDPVSQFLVGLPVVVLYNFTIILLFFRYRAKRQTKRAAVAPVATEIAEPETEVPPPPNETPEPESKPEPEPELPRERLQPALQARAQTSYQPRLIMDIQPRTGTLEAPEAEAA